MHINKLNLSFGLEKIFENVTIQIPEKEKIGIVGVNGAGKTTLFRLILKEIEPDSGTITFEQKRRISYLPQVITSELEKDENVLEFLLKGRPIEKLQNKIANLYEEVILKDEKEQQKILDKISLLQMELDYYEPYEAESILLKLVEGMNITDELLDKNLKELSGGQKSKVAFARLLYSKPDVSLLDEPTNHLDSSTRDFVLSYLKQYDGSIFVISHDTKFLDEFTSRILYIDKKHHDMRLFTGNYSKFLKILEEEKIRTEKVSEIQQKEKEKLEEIIARYIHGNEKKAKIAKDRIKKLERLEKEMVTVEKEMKSANIKLEQKRESTKFPLKVEEISFKYDINAKRNLLYKLSFDINRGERFLIVGENGTGKSTLLKLIVGLLSPQKGKITYGARTDVGYYAQEHEGLDFSKTVFENLEDFPLTDTEKKGILGKFLFEKDDLDKLVGVLSPGERARLALARLSLTKSNLLVLDEPTNHLDPKTQKKMSDNLKEYNGTMIIVSHNISFVEDFNIERILILPEGRIYYYKKEIIEKYYNLAKEEEKKKKI